MNDYPISYYLVPVYTVIVFSPWVIRRYLLPYFSMKRLKAWFETHPHKALLESAEGFLEILYKKDKMSKTIKQSKKYKKVLGDASVYGEIRFMSLIKLLDLAEPKPHEVLIDLGCGTGKTLLTAGLCFPLKEVIGIEYIKEIYISAKEKLKALKELLKAQEPFKVSPVKLVHGDLFDYKLHKADIIFINATCFGDEMMKRLFKKFEHLKSGARVIITSHQIPSDSFKEIHSGRYPMSWGLNSARIYIKQ